MTFLTFLPFRERPFFIQYLELLLFYDLYVCLVSVFFLLECRNQFVHCFVWKMKR